MKHQIKETDVPFHESRARVLGDVEWLAGGSDAEDIEGLRRYPQEMNRFRHCHERRTIRPDSAIDVAGAGMGGEGC